MALSRFFRWLAPLVLLFPAGHALADCGFAPAGPVPNVLWSFQDSVSACPAGDSLSGTGRPSRLRVHVSYMDANCNPRGGVPPDSIWLTYSTVGGVIPNDQSAQIFADDSTDANGNAFITITSFSGCGTLNLALWVSGVRQSAKTATVRSADSNADGRVTSDDYASLNFCDLNYDGVWSGIRQTFRGLACSLDFISID